MIWRTNVFLSKSIWGEARGLEPSCPLVEAPVRLRTEGVEYVLTLSFVPSAYKTECTRKHGVYSIFEIHPKVSDHAGDGIKSINGGTWRAPMQVGADEPLKFSRRFFLHLEYVFLRKTKC